MTRAIAVLPLAILAVVAVLSLRSGGHGLYHAEFSDARGLVAGNDVRVDGAIAGRVHSIELTRAGTADVAFSVDRRVAPRADAVAAIRPVDLLGDNYLSLSPGQSKVALRGAIPRERTSNAPRLDDALRTFQPPVRSGLKALLVEGGLALDSRGADLARAATELRPALSAAQSVSDELGSQNAALGRLVPAAERAASQVGGRERDLGPLVDGLARTLAASKSGAGSLGPGLDGMPALLARLRGTSDRLASAASAARPVAAALDTSAASLSEVVDGMPALLDRARVTAVGLQPAVGSARELLGSAAPALSELRAALPQVLSAAPSIDHLMAEFDAAAPGISKGFFENFPDQAAEPGNQPLDPFADPQRAYWRGAAVFSCEAFGVPVKPGCLDQVLARQRAAARKQKHGSHVTLPAPKTPSLPKTPALPKPPSLTNPLPQPPKAPALPDANKLLDYLLGP